MMRQNDARMLGQSVESGEAGWRMRQSCLVKMRKRSVGRDGDRVGRCCLPERRKRDVE